MKLLNRDFFNRPTPEVARDLLGKRLVREWRGHRLSGIIVETEAYQINEPACHAYRGLTPRTAALFGPVGHSYVYFIYGMYYCLNVVSHAPDIRAGGVLIRALLPEEGIEEMKIARKIASVKQLANGPGKITQALHITRAEEHIDVTHRGPLYIEEGIKIPKSHIVTTPRIGISCATDKLWRFVVKKS